MGSRRYGPLLRAMAPGVGAGPSDCARSNLAGCVALPQAAQLQPEPPAVPFLPADCSSGAVGCVRLPVSRHRSDLPSAEAKIRFVERTSSAIAIGSATALSIVVGDVDNDGDLDVVVGNEGAPNQLLLNDGNGAFAEVTDSAIAVGSADTWSIALGDVDNDGDLDVVVGNSYSYANQLLLNDGSGGFAEATDSAIAVGAAMTQSIALGDVDNDGDLDVVVGNREVSNQLLAFVHCTGSQSGRTSFGQGCVSCPRPFSRQLAIHLDFCAECDAHTQLDFTALCATCTPGFQRPFGSDSCTACPVGAWQATPGSACSNCSRGYYSAFAGSVLCFPCVPGVRRSDMLHLYSPPPLHAPLQTSSTPCTLLHTRSLFVCPFDKQVRTAPARAWTRAFRAPPAHSALTSVRRPARAARSAAIAPAPAPPPH